MKFIRMIFLLLCGAGGGWAALQGIQRVTGVPKIDFTDMGPGMLLVVPVVAIGVAIGMFIGGLIFPNPRR